MNVDLHLHTNNSDGVISVENLIKTLKDNAITIFSKTDHDTVKGNRETMHLAQKLNLICIPGTELSTFVKNGVQGLDETFNIHIVGLGINSEMLEDYCNSVASRKQLTLRNIVKKVHDCGFKIDLEDVLSQGRIVDRGAIAAALVKKGCFATKKDAFDSLLNTPDLIKLSVFSNDIKTTVTAIHQAGGIAIWAHPFKVTRGGEIELSEKQVEQILKHMLNAGIDGIESYYQSFSIAQKQFLHTVALNNGLLESYGSDYHGRSEKELRMLKKVFDAKTIHPLLKRLNIDVY